MSDDQGYIIEFHRVGNSVKASAMDRATLTEVSMVGSTNASDAELISFVVRKLEYMLAKRAPDPGNR